MKLSLIWICSDREEKNRKTFDFLQKELKSDGSSAQVLLYGISQKPAFLPEETAETISWEPVYGFEGASECEIYKDAADKVTGEFVTQMYSGDVWSDNTLAELSKQIKKHSAQSIVMLQKIMPDGAEGAFAHELSSKTVCVQKLTEKFYCYPFYFGGTFIKRELFRKQSFDLTLGLDAERRFFLDICAEKMQVLYIKSRSYFSSVEREGDPVFYKGLYSPDYYDKAFTDFWIPYFDSLREKYGEVPAFIQYHLMFTIGSRIDGNLNNKNKHVIPEGEEQNCLKLMGQALKQVDDKIMFNGAKVPECIVADSLKWIFGVLKYGEQFCFEEYYLSGIPYYASGKVVFNAIPNLKTNIMFMQFLNGRLEIDGTVHTILYEMADEVFFTYEGKKYSLEYNGRYALTKVYGVSIYKRHSFHVSIPVNNKQNAFLFCFAKIGAESIKIRLDFNSHFSRMSGAFLSSYWCFGDDTTYMMTKGEDGLSVKPADKGQARKQERKLQREMLFSLDKRAWMFLLVRNAYFCARPFMKRKPIWMYLDKIYKGGDSAEYLFRYASAQGKNIKHYYLVDKKAADYKRLKRDGYHPLVRGSIKHRLVFLLADMMVISNSTVFAFNNYGLLNSSYVRDLYDFHVCCVQHGMSVQKIAVAQNRLRDNTRLYFCASQYEIKNLSRPVYDYVGYNALRLTGVPRYDGLVNDDKKQIMISPTWRMQAAAPVRTSEGEQRDYNPLFKESEYYKVYNALINDTRLIEAAKKYGYRIKYVLHPIVSAQVGDFDKDDYVDIVPAVGDMSYERMFCESSLMVTDYSGIQFDFAYMRKPLVYLHHRDIPQHYEEGTFFYDTMAFGEICHDNDELIDVLCEYMENGCQMKEEYVKRADDFFHYNDRNNCERIYKAMLSYQNRYILHRQEKLEFVFEEGKNVELDVDNREQDVQEFKALVEAKKGKIGKTTIVDSFYDLPIREKTVLMVGLGKNVRGSLQYILNALNHAPQYEGYEVYVRTSEETDAVVHEYIKNNAWTRTHTVLDNREYGDLMESVKYLIAEVYFPESWIKKEGQIYINIWHGTPLKKLGLAKPSRGLHKDGTAQRNFIEADYLLYPNDYTRTHMLESYKVSELMYGKTVMLGYPRTGGMLAAAESDLTELKKQLAPNGEKIYAYMPTWRDYLEEEQVVSEAKELLLYLDAHLDEQQILYVNLHHKVSDSLDYSGFKRIKKFPPAVDSYALLAASEALITDYSSVFYDYLALRRQIILYCADYELYRSKRGTYMDLMSLPFDKAKTPEDVINALNRGKRYDDKKAHKTFCAYDTKENAAKLCSIILGEQESGLAFDAIPKTGGERILIYSDACGQTDATKTLQSALLNKAQKYKKLQNKHIYIGCDAEKVDLNRDSAYPMLSRVPVLGLKQEVHFSALGKSVLRHYKKGNISFDKAMQYLKYDYVPAVRNMFGRAQFDAVLIYDLQDADRMLALTMMQADKYLFVNADMLKEMAEGNQFLCDAVGYAAAYARAVFADSEETRVGLEQLVEIKIPVQLIDGGEQLRQLLAEKLGR